MLVLGEAGMIRSLALQTKAAEPVIGQVKVDFITQIPPGIEIP